MSRSATDLLPVSFGGWNHAEELRKWSFLRRTPQQRLDWLTDALTICLLARSAAKIRYAGDDPAGHPDDPAVPNEDPAASWNDGFGPGEDRPRPTDDAAGSSDDRIGPKEDTAGSRDGPIGPALAPLVPSADKART
jgi:hypothetical protein